MKRLGLSPEPYFRDPSLTVLVVAQAEEDHGYPVLHAWAAGAGGVGKVTKQEIIIHETPSQFSGNL